MEKKYYIAYGSNLNLPQMHLRCPDARLLGTAKLENWRLLFRGSKTGSYLTIEQCDGGAVPVAVWEITERDERNLDRYEGFPNFYYKKAMTIDIKGIRTGKIRRRKAFAYIMHENRPIGVPDYYYMSTCFEGYRSFGFDIDVLLNAYDYSKENAQ